VTSSTALVIALAGVGVYALTKRGHETKPRAFYVRKKNCVHTPAHSHMKGVGKPSLVFLTLLIALLAAAVVFAVAT
jgi:hypothetical protein